MSLSSLIIKRPHVSEKGTDISRLRKYVFLVDVTAKSGQIRDAIQAIYNVKIVSINIVNVRTKDKRLKKAIVTLKEGDKIDIIPH